MADTKGSSDDDELKVFVKDLELKQQEPLSTNSPASSSSSRPPSAKLRKIEVRPSKSPVSRPTSSLSIEELKPSQAHRRKNIRNVLDEVSSSSALEAQERERQRLERMAQRASSSASYAPVLSDGKQVINISSDESSDDDLEFLCEVKHKPVKEEFPRRVIPPIPSSSKATASSCQNGYTQELFDAGIPGTSKSYQAQEDEKKRIRKQKRRNKYLELLESLELNAQGRLLINHGKPDDDPDVFVAPHLTTILKPHQLGGIRFLYDNIIENVKTYDPYQGFGCVLAHSMGLGKTLQIVTFVEIFLRTVAAKHVLIITPVNVLQNWNNEFKKWLPKRDAQGNLIRTFHVFLLGDLVKSFEDRRDLISGWRREGGVLLMGYDMFRLLVNKQEQKPNDAFDNASGKKVFKRNRPEYVDKTVLNDDQRIIRRALIDPGPDLIVCDEGHRIKCLKSSISNALNQIRTKRRIVLTGYPLQNNLIEYYCMVNFVRPNYLGTKKEFSSMFDRPIRNGQCIDSTVHDKKVANKKTYLLSKMVEGFVQRRSAFLLKKILPENREYVLVLHKSPIQVRLYRAFLEYCRIDMYSTKRSFNPLKAHAICTKIWNHPDLLYVAYMKQKQEREKTNDLTASSAFNSMMRTDSLSSAADQMRLFNTSKNDFCNIFKPADQRDRKMVFDLDAFEDIDVIGNETSYDWAGCCFGDYEPGKLENSTKLMATFELLKDTCAKGEKILLFSSSVMTLNIIERLLLKSDIEMKDAAGKTIRWMYGRTYSRFDGSTSGVDREKLIDRFNTCPENHLFLISTRAGSLGINLVSATRVIIFDASWNPCHDAQAVCRVYRYGQEKKTFVYRLVTHNSMERVIFNRQISKHGLQNKVVDNLKVAANVTTKDLEDLLVYDATKDIMVSRPETDNWNIDDDLLKKSIGRLPIAEEPFLHESMMLEAEEDLSAEERKEIELSLTQVSSGVVHDPASRVANNPGAVDLEQQYRNMMMMRSMHNNYANHLNTLHKSEFTNLGLGGTQYEIASQAQYLSPRPPYLPPPSAYVPPQPQNSFNGHASFDNVAPNYPGYPSNNYSDNGLHPSGSGRPMQPNNGYYGPGPSSLNSYTPYDASGNALNGYHNPNMMLRHPLQMDSANSMVYRMNNAPVVRPSRNLDSSLTRIIEEDILLKSVNNSGEKVLRKGQIVQIMKMSSRTYLKPLDNTEIYDATGTIYDPRDQGKNTSRPSFSNVIQID